jgi:hypothetical protein
MVKASRTNDITYCEWGKTAADGVDDELGLGVVNELRAGAVSLIYA